jgi:hypothetical protein
MLAVNEVVLFLICSSTHTKCNSCRKVSQNSTTVKHRQQIANVVKVATNHSITCFASYLDIA